MSAETTQEAPNVTVLETLDQPAAEPTETPAETPAEPEKSEQERDDSGKFQKNGTQARFDELTRQRYEAQREAAYWREQAMAQQPKPKEPEQPQAKPVAANFESYEAFVEAQTEWAVKQALAERDRADQQRQRASQAQAQAQSWAERVNSAKTELPDFDLVMSSSTAPMSQAMAEAIRESEQGPKVAYHLAQNPAEAARIAQLSPLAAAREIGKLESSLSAPKAQEKRTTQAPAPAKTAVGSGRSTEGDPSKMSQADYLVWRNSQLKERR